MAIKDSVLKWADDEIKYAPGLLGVQWQVPLLLLNSTGDRAIGIMLNPDTAQSATLDNLKWVAAERQGSRWAVYIAKMTSAYWERDVDGRPHTLDEMKVRALEYFIEAGALGSGKCAVKDEFINSQFTEDLREAHKDFLSK
jgi:hypothetical protein